MLAPIFGSYLIRCLKDLYLEHQKRVILENAKTGEGESTDGQKTGVKLKKKNHRKWGRLDKKRNDVDLPQIRNPDYGLYNA